jgi:hypothetical protein
MLSPGLRSGLRCSRERAADARGFMKQATANPSSTIDNSFSGIISALCRQTDKISPGRSTIALRRRNPSPGLLAKRSFDGTVQFGVNRKFVVSRSCSSPSQYACAAPESSPDCRGTCLFQSLIWLMKAVPLRHLRHRRDLAQCLRDNLT